MKIVHLIAACALLGCAAHIYRVKIASTTCEALVATDCKDPPADPNRIRLCGNAFANESDFEAEAKHYCATPALRNCALQCCDVDCGAMAAPPATPPPAAPVSAPSNAATAPVQVSPAPDASLDELPPAPPPPPTAPAETPAAAHHQSEANKP